MEYYSSHINKLIEQLSHLPGIGAKSAQRLAFHIMNMPKDQVEQLTASITDARQNVQYCKCCYTLTDQELCPICANPKGITARSWWLRIPGIWQHMRKQVNLTVYIMYFMVRSPRCLGSGRMISN